MYYNRKIGSYFKFSGYIKTLIKNLQRDLYMFFVFIGGQSASGKTGVSLHLRDELRSSGIGAQIVNMDDYFLECPPDTVDINAYRRNTNFDRPEMLDFNLFKKHIIELSQNKPITKPLFDFPTNTRKGQETINPSDVIIIEGIFGQYFYDNFLPANLPALSVNVATEQYLDIVKRRVLRDVQYRGRTKEDVELQEKKFVGPGFFKFTAPHAHADIYINNSNKETPEEQDVLLKEAAIEIKAEVKKRISDKNQGIVHLRKPAPNVQEMVAKSHFLAGILAGEHINPTRFYNGVFGSFVGDKKHEFAKADVNRFTLIADLKKYTDRIAKHKENDDKTINFKYDFWLFKNSRALNREANFYLAKKLLTNLYDHPELSIQQIFKDVLEQRSEIITSKGINNHPQYVERKINSSELKAIIAKATRFAAEEPHPPKLSI
mgnify:CR=1 FL=1